MGLLCPPAYSARFCTGPARVFVQGLCTVAPAAAPLCAGFPRCGRRVCGRWVCGRGGFCFLFGSGVCLRFSVSGVSAGVGPCVFGCWLVLLPSLALFGGLPLDPDYAVPAAEKKKNIARRKKRPLERTFCCAEKSVQIIWRWTGGRGEGRCRFWRFWLISSFFWRNCI